MSATLPYPWQQATWSSLFSRFRQGQLPHGLLFNGTAGVGKRHMANCLAEFVLCSSPQNDAACGSCKSCELIKAGTHPDLQSVSPEEQGKAIKIDQVRKLNDFLGQTSQQGGYKVAILAPAEAMNINAANALLKNLEEPSARTLIILISDAPNRLMATIRSRCQAVAFAVPALEEASRWLSPLCGDHKPEALLNMCSGAPLAARDLLDDGRLEARLSFADDLNQIAAGQMFSLQAAARWMDAEPLMLIEALLTWLQSASRQEVQGDIGQLMESELQLLQLLQTVGVKLRFRLYDKLLQSKAQILSGANPNQQLLLEEIAMDWQAMMASRKPMRPAI
ncbi:DNA polymerase III subunit delta' [uncultured Pseudoteredinibacter sp.]|uniref:DNA polymerase III subunit delta' n=1 Tax=uncultured Pseudoteredinibacter sp. TaxID=1641701 RepID=UPI002633BA7E|nr:DNA polymerase III subunit delta' [uncultured Pseudoteredinibacter sp.]